MSDDTLGVTIDEFSVPDGLEDEAPAEPLTEEQILENVRQTIAHWASIRGECDECEVLGYQVLYTRSLAAVGDGELDMGAYLAAEGWEHLTDRAGAIRRCAHHGPKYPWAADLDPVKVRDWIEAERVKHAESAFTIDFDALKALL